MDVDQVWNALENHGLKLPMYVIKLLLCTGYDNLQSLSKLTTSQLIEELETYATDNLDTCDLGLSESEGKYYFNRRTSKFNILPGHKHLITAAAETAIRLLQQPEHETESEFEKIPDENDLDQSSLDDDKASINHNGLHFLSEFSTLGNRANSRISKSTVQSDVSPESVISVEEEQHSLVEFLKTWIARKVLSGLLEPFLFDVDYKVQVYRPKSSNQTSRSDVYSFVCLRCNTTIRAFKRPNGQNWNAANVCRHISTVHFIKPPTKTHKVNQRSTYLVSSLSTPPLSDSPIEQDPLD